MAAPGCFGKIVNILDSSNTVARNWLLTDKPHMEAKTHHAETLGVSSLSKSQGNGTKMLFMDQIEDKMIVSELRRSSSLKKANEIPMNVLIAQDGSKEFEPKHTSTNVVARLMGLDTMPISHRSSAEQRRSEIHSRRCLSQSEMLMCSEHQGDLLDTKMQFEGSHHLEQNKHADLYEMWKKLQKENAKNNSLQSHNGRIYNEIKKKKMAFVRQKFVEAKCLASDEKGRQSKEFQDALEVLSSNKELFLKFLQEPSSLFTLNLHHTSVSQPCETTHITVLRPSKNGDVKLFGPEKMANKETKNQAQMGRATVYHKNTDQPTRIVVLKPSPARAPEMKAVFSSPTPSSRKIPREGFFYCESKAKENMWKMQKNVIGHQMKGNVASSMFSNTNAGDSSCNKSETEYVLENISDSEVVSPSSRHSWEYIKKTGSPFNSSFSQPMCSPVSSVSREAKMRLSDRWAMMTPIDVFHEESNAWRSSSTLGEMLALSNSMKFTKTEELATSKNPAPELSTSSFICNMNAEKSVVGSPKFLLRSKSASLSSTVYFPLVNPKASPILETNDVSEGVLQQKRHKSSFKMKVSRLFFSRNKKSSNGENAASQSLKASELQVKASRKIQGNGEYQHVENSDQKECSPQSLHGSSKSVYLDLAQPQNKPGLVFEEGELFAGNVGGPWGSTSENQDQPSPNSVLEPPFPEDENLVSVQSDNFKQTRQVSGEVLVRSNLIDKSPLIESVARTLTWDRFRTQTATLRQPSSFSPAAEDEVDYCVLHAQKLLSAVAPSGKEMTHALFARWHSPECLLDPEVKGEHGYHQNEYILEEARAQKQEHLRQKLVCDCVNEAANEIACSVLHFFPARGGLHSIEDHVCLRMREWCNTKNQCGGSISPVENRVVKKDVAGRGWLVEMRWEFDDLGKDIEEKLLGELVEDAVLDFTLKSIEMDRRLLKLGTNCLSC